MDWGTIFTIANMWAILWWALLVFAPRGPKTHSLIFYLGIGGLALFYAVGLISSIASNGMAEFGSIDGVRAAFGDDGLLVNAWVHYLAFDLFVGQWIAKDADLKGFSRVVQGPILFFTLMAGPLGLLVWMIVRERRARATAHG